MAAKQSARSNRYCKEIYSLLRTMYATGRFKSIDEMQRTCKKAGMLVPSVSAIEKIASHEKWDKSEKVEEVQEITNRMAAEAFAALGVPPERVVKKIAEGMFLPETAIAKINEHLTSMVKEGFDMAKIELLQNAVKAFVVERNCAESLSIKYLQEYLKLTSMYPAQKHEVTGKNGKPIDVRSPDLSDKEANERIKKMLKNDPQLMGVLKEMIGNGERSG